MRRLIYLAAVFLTSNAQAVPPDRLVLMAPGDDRFEKAPQGDWEAVSSNPQVVKARCFDTAEVYLQAGSSGSALVLLANQVLGQIKVWRVKVSGDSKAVKPDPALLKKLCACQGSGYPITCRVENSACLGKLRELLQDSDLAADDIKILYSVEGLQALLRDLAAATKSGGHRGVEFAFSGANLRITGQVPDKQAWHRLILAIYAEMVGKLVIDNRVEWKNPTKK